MASERNGARHPPDAAEPLRRRLVERLIARRAARSPAVIGALETVARHRFLPQFPLELAYADRSIALSLERGVTVSSISQPSMIAEMLEQLAVRPGDRVLEIGTGSGYNAALLAELCGPEGRVVTIEVDPGLAEQARTALRAAGYERVRVVAGDGVAGAPEHAPFDRILLTVAADDLVPAWRAQLAPEGRLVLPLILNVLQESVAFEGPPPLHSVSVLGASFVTLRGDAAVVPHEIVLRETVPPLRLRVRDTSRIDPDGLARRLAEAPVAVKLGMIRAEDVWGGLDVWLDAHLPTLALATTVGEVDAAAFASWLTVVSEPPPFGMTLAVCDGDAVALAVRDRSGDVGLAAYGRAGRLVAAVRGAVARWIAAGRPSTRVLRIAAHADAPLDTQPADVVIPKRTVTLALSWASVS